MRRSDSSHLVVGEEKDQSLKDIQEQDEEQNYMSYNCHDEESLSSSQLEEQHHQTIEIKRQPRRSSIGIASNTISKISNVTKSNALYTWRIVLCVVLIISMLTTSSLVYMYISQSEYNEYQRELGEYQFSISSDSYLIVKSMQHHLYDTINSADTIIVNIVSTTKLTNQTWPLITVPNFPLLSSKILSLSKAILLSLHPLVTIENRNQWENYTKYYNEQWINDTILIHSYEEHDDEDADENLFREGSDRYQHYTNNDTIKWNVIYDENEYLKDDAGLIGTNRTREYYLPLWQNYPIAMLSSSTHIVPSILHVMKDKNIVLCSSHNDMIIPNETTKTVEDDPHDDHHENAVEAIMDIYYPIMDHNYLSSTNDYSNDTILGILKMKLYWSELMKDILPYKTNPLHVVFDNQCHSIFTFLIVSISGMSFVVTKRQRTTNMRKREKIKKLSSHTTYFLFCYYPHLCCGIC